MSPAVLLSLLALAAADGASRTDAARRAAVCEGDAPSVHLLQTSAVHTHHTAATVGETGGAGALTVKASVVGRQAALSQAWGASIAKTMDSSAVCFILPILGFIFALIAIFATVLFERGMAPDAASLKKVPDADGRLPAAAARRLPAAGRGAEELLHGTSPHYGYRRPQLNVKPPPAQDGSLMGGYGGGFAVQPPLPPPATASRGHVMVEVPPLPLTRALGLTLSEDELTVTGFAEPIASSYGFQVGDRIVALNGIPVEVQEDFVQQLGLARKRSAASGEPLLFTVVRGGAAAELVSKELPWSGSGPAGTEPLDPTLFVGTWCYEDAGHSGGHRYIIRREVGGQLIFTQALPDGNSVKGVLKTTGEANTREAELHLSGGGERHGTVLFRLREKGTLVSNLRPEGDTAFGEDIVARLAKTARKKEIACWSC